MYSNNFAAFIKTKSGVLREFKDVVYLPYGAEYTIGLKNINTKDAVVNVTIDGKDVLDGKSIVVKAGKTTEIEGYLKGLTARNRFKFIKKTKKIEAFRGNNPCDGLVVVDFCFVKEKSLCYDNLSSYYHPYYDYRLCAQHHHYESPNDLEYSPTYYRWSCDTTILPQDTKKAKCRYQTSTGITVPGSETNQQFVATDALDLETEHNVLVFRLKNPKDSKKSKAITTRSKIQCPTCGTKSTANCKFCHECGTFIAKRF